ncbi:hypothetical protein [Rhodococcus sp. HNM0569]|uniref:hypothetical protein n=1 Tax=Rhodococcus sp. HNM0569 TaxID=2716340 RepID=UPI00146DF9B1|nr:hypothetical protein [Rhodococcus sp. HNM0569]NLU82442.1 hypothetical protein [Rhodococcus sp. HNM0569]
MSDNHGENGTPDQNGSGTDGNEAHGFEERLEGLAAEIREELTILEGGDAPDPLASEDGESEADGD